MKRRMTALLLALVLALGLTTTAGAYTDEQMKAADALYHLNLFLGTSTTSKVYNLDGKLNRAEGTILLLRMIGEESKAETTDPAENPFADVTGWTMPYVTYAWKAGVVNGTSTTTFAPAREMSDNMFLTLVLRVLGYSDTSSADFVWTDPYALAARLGLIASTAADNEFTRGDAVMIFWNAMDAKFKGSNETMADSLINAGVFTAAEYAEAKEIWTYGHILEDEPGVVPDPKPSEPTEPTPSEKPEIDEGVGGENDFPII